jgi:hypothetical protein
MWTIIRKFQAGLLGFLFCFLFFPTHARIIKVLIAKTQLYCEGKIFGGTGQYERIYRQTFGEVDPNLTFNKIIQDLLLGVGERRFYAAKRCAKDRPNCRDEQRTQKIITSKMS